MPQIDLRQSHCTSVQVKPARIMKESVRLLILVTCLCVLAVASRADVRYWASTNGCVTAAGTWDPTGGTNWTLVPNSCYGDSAWVTADDATFAGAADTNAVLVTGSLTANSIHVSSNGYHLKAITAANTLTLSSGKVTVDAGCSAIVDYVSSTVRIRLASPDINTPIIFDGRGTFRIDAGTTVNNGNSIAVAQKLWITNGGTYQSYGNVNSMPDRPASYQADWLVLDNDSQITFSYTDTSSFGANGGVTIGGTGSTGGKISVASGKTIKFLGKINSGANATLTKLGTGTLSLGAANNTTLLGPIVLQSGVLECTASQTLYGPITLAATGLRINSSNTFNLYGGITGTNTDVTFSGNGSISISNLNIGTGVLTRDAVTASQNFNLATSNTMGGLVIKSGARVYFNDIHAAGTGTITVNSNAFGLASTVGDVRLANNISLDSGAYPQFYSHTVNSTGFELLGIISGQGGLVRTNSSTSSSAAVKLSGDNTFSGGVRIACYGLRLGHKNALGTGPLAIGDPALAPDSLVPAVSNGHIVLTADADLTGANALTNPVAIYQDFATAAGQNLELSGPVALSGARTLTVTNALTLLGDVSDGTPVGNGITNAGSGKLILKGNNTYSGNTVVSAGTLQADSASGSATSLGSVTVASGAMLSGSGRVGAAGTGTVSIQTDGTISAGNGSTATLTVLGDLVLNGTNVCDVSVGGADLVAVVGNLDLTGSTLNLNVSGTPTAASYTIATYGGNLTGTFGTVTGLPADYTVAYSQGGHNIALVKQSSAPGNGTITVNSDGTFQLRFVGTPQTKSYVATSTNIAAPMSTWVAIAGSTNLITNSSGAWSFTVTNDSPRRFFRSVDGLTP
jgi:fibronectin-binding autotransporter adhesin